LLARYRRRAGGSTARDRVPRGTSPVRLVSEKRMTVQSERDVEGLKAVGKVVSTVLKGMLDAIEHGMTPAELDDVGRRLLERHGARSAQQVG